MQRKGREGDMQKQWGRRRYKGKGVVENSRRREGRKGRVGEGGKK